MFFVYCYQKTFIGNFKSITRLKYSHLIIQHYQGHRVQKYTLQKLSETFGFPQDTGNET